MNELFNPLEVSDAELEEILINSKFENSKWSFDKVSNDFVSKFHRIYRTIVLDGLLPLGAISGISIGTFKNSSVFDLTNYVGIKESLVEVMNNFSLLLFPPQNEDIKIKCLINSRGDVLSNSLTFIDNAQKIYFPITNCYLFNVSKSVELDLRLSTGTGLNRISTKAKDKNFNRKFLPIRVSYGLYKFINVVGYDKSNIYHSINNKLDCNILKSILINFILGEENQTEISHNISEIFNVLYSRISRYGKAINAIKELFYYELNSDTSYKEIRDNYFLEEQKSLEYGRNLSKDNIISIKKNNKEFDIFKDLFIRQNINETANHLAGIPKISNISAVKIAEILHEFV